jgi:uncharacterized repeat protein (TIGR03803 family)
LKPQQSTLNHFMKTKIEIKNPSWMQFKSLLTALPCVPLFCLATVNSSAQTYEVVHHFGGSNGANPSGLVLGGDTLYGTTRSPGQGAVFKVGTDGAGYAILHTFTGGDGSGISGDLALSGTALYGTTPFGGSTGCGTVFKLNTDGSGFTVLKNFVQVGNMWYPRGGLVVSGTTLYGTTFEGAVFKLQTDGSGFTDLQVNAYGLHDTLALSGNMLYGMPFYSCPFKVNINGSGFNCLCSISHPTGGLTLSGTTLYGTAIQYDSAVKGFAFKVNTDGSGYVILHSFGPSSNDGSPYGGMVLSGTMLFGTTSDGGGFNKGTVFKLNTDGSGYTVLHSFTGSEGANPYSALTLSGTTLYGTTVYGGNLDGGVLFSLSVAPPTIVTSPQSQTAESGRTVNFTAGTVGDPVLTYMWYFNVTNLVSYSTNGSLELSNVQLSQSGAYFVVVTNLFGAATSSPAMLNVIAVPPIILRPPVAETVELGADVDLSLKVDGSLPLSFQWQFAGTNLINDTTNPDLLLTNAQLSQSGSYVVVVSNFFGSVTSAPTMLNVIPAVERRPVPGVNMTGDAGSMLNVDSASSLSPAPNWTPLGSVSLTSTSQFYFDLSAPLPPQRFYRAWQTGTPGVVPSLNLNFVPAITLTGNVGDSLRLDYINAIGPTDAWVTLATVTLTNTSQLYFDVSSIGQPRRLYRIVPAP